MNCLRLLGNSQICRIRSKDNRVQANAKLNPVPNQNRMSCTQDVVRTPLDSIMSSRYNKLLGFTIEERQRLNIHGLLPICVRSMEDELYMIESNFNAIESNIEKYRYLRDLRQSYERLYFRYVSDHVTQVLPIIYTPTVGHACMVFGALFRGTCGLFITKYDRGHMEDIMRNWPNRDQIKAICVTDGQRILGLGDLGANGMGISVGKMELYTALAGIPPNTLLPMCLDVGTTNAELRADPLYIGLREDRLTGKEYDDLVDEFVKSLVKVYGPQTLIHFEDFATPNAFKFLDKYQDKYLFFNDDIQGTAVVGLAGLLGIKRITEKELQNHVIVFAGAGSATVGMVDLLKKEMMSQGLSEQEAAKNVYIVDQPGLITKKSKDIPKLISAFAKDMPPIKSLEEVVEKVKPSIILGATAHAGLFSEKILRNMAKNHERPAVFAFSNPTNKSECTAEQAYKFTDGRAIFSAGSPFPPVEFKGKRLTPGQANNCFAFPGLVLGVMTALPETIPEEVYLVGARSLANFPSKEELACGRIYPQAAMAKEVALKIAEDVAHYLFDNCLARLHEEPKCIRKYLLENSYQLNYGCSVTLPWEYPKMQPNPCPPAKCSKK